MVVVLVLGAFVIRQISHGDYVVALAQALLVIGANSGRVVVACGTRARASPASGTLLTRYFLSVGMPFRALDACASPISPTVSAIPIVLSRSAADEMAAFRWVQGVDWQTSNSRGHGRACSPPRHGMHASVASSSRCTRRWAPSPALVLHIRLLGRLMADYYDTKRREQEQRQNAYMHAIYETGSRLTHDVKNLLQSLELAVLGRGNPATSATRRPYAGWFSASCRRSRRDFKARWTS